ncbi:MAG: flagellin [Rhodobacterales bacterium]
MIGTVRTMSTQDALVTQRRTAADLSQRLAQAGQEASTGIKADIFRSLGLRASEALTLRAGMARNETFISSNEMLASRLDLTALTLRQARDAAQGFLDLAISNTESPTQTASALQRAAQTALDRLIGNMNASFRGVPLFAGTDSAQPPLQGWDTVNAATGLAPRDVLALTIDGGIGDAADAAAKAARLADIFASATVLPEEARFENTFFNGTPLLADDGTALPRVAARLDEGTVLPHGIQANDPAFTDLLRGLSMFAATDTATIADPEAYRIWVGDAVNAISRGIAGMIDTESRLGGQQQTVDQTLKNQRERHVLYNSQVLSLEGVDPYEAATRLTNLQTQLEATYTVTARLSRLSFLNFM